MRQRRWNAHTIATRPTRIGSTGAPPTVDPIVDSVSREPLRSLTISLIAPLSAEARPRPPASRSTCVRTNPTASDTAIRTANAENSAAKKTATGWRRPMRSAKRSAGPPGRAHSGPVAQRSSCACSRLSRAMRVSPFPGGYCTHGLDHPSTRALSLPLLALVLATVVVGTAVALLARRWPHVDPRPDEPLAGWARRRDPGAATGLALSVALVVLVGGGLLLVLLAFLLRGDPDAIGLDAAAAKWGAAHATPFTNDVLGRLTNVGRPNSVILLAAALAVVQTIRTRNLWIAPFLIVVVAGNGFVTTAIKHFADRVRPSFNPAAAALGPSFPSGHSSWTAAFFAAAALVLAREATRRQRVV